MLTSVLLTRQFFSGHFQISAVVNRPVDALSVGQKLNLNGEQFVKANNSGLLLMTGTYTCPQGKKIAGGWVECIYCDNNHGYYDYNARACACDSGYNLRNLDKACIACPDHSNWSTEGQLCQCSANYYMLGDNDTCMSCPANSTSDIGSTSFNDCLCAENYYMNGDNCSVCTSGGVSPKGSTSASACVTIDDITDIMDTTNCSNPVAFMSVWNNCSSLAEHETTCLVDPRDYHTYRVRKLADGKCWMIDSLKFGGNYGDTDGCATNGGIGNFGDGGSYDETKAQETFAPGFYGHCRAVNSTYDNYLYDWVATLQSTLAYNGSDTRFPGTQQGICPTGWHVPSGLYDGELNELVYVYNGESSLLRDSTKANLTFSGKADSWDGSLFDVGDKGYYWSSSCEYSDYASPLTISPSSVTIGFSSYDVLTKDYGLAVRCVKD